jgi:CBS domain-containing protein
LVGQIPTMEASVPAHTTTPPLRGALVPVLADATVSDAMNPGIYACPADMPLRGVARMMSNARVHAIAVMGISDEGDPDSPQVWGIVSDLDLVQSGLRTGLDRTAGDCALAPVLTVEANAPLCDAGELMISRGVQHLVVVAPGTARPVGILSTLDVAGIIAWGGD